MGSEGRRAEGGGCRKRMDGNKGIERMERIECGWDNTL